MNSGEVLYIGNFRLPDQNAAAHRVLNMGKSLRDLGFNVVYFGVGKRADPYTPLYAEGFRYYNVFSIRQRDFFREVFCISHIKQYIESNRHVRMVIAYNYPSIALGRLVRYCRKRGICIIADCTEWYNGRGINPLKGLLMGADSALRMRVVHKRMDGIITISSYLHQYYSRWLPALIVPPTVDLSDEKFKQQPKNHSCTVIVYSGNPSASKESLNRAVECVAGMADRSIELHIIGVTKEQYMRIYGDVPEARNVVFFGYLSHRESLSEVASSDYALIVRPNNRVTKAGFPTKFAEAISCGTPVIATRTSDLEKYLTGDTNGFLVEPSGLNTLFDQICSGVKTPEVKRSLFHYENYTKKIGDFLVRIGVEVCIDPK